MSKVIRTQDNQFNGTDYDVIYAETDGQSVMIEDKNKHYNSVEKNAENIFDEIGEKIGDLNKLNTTNKISVVDSINTISGQLAEKTIQINSLDINKVNKTELQAVNISVTNLQNIKADTVYVDNKIATVASGAPDETFATVVALQAAHPTGDIKNKLVSSDGHIYNWDGTKWKDTGILYQSQGLADGSVIKTKYGSNSLPYFALDNALKNESNLINTFLDSNYKIKTGQFLEERINDIFTGFSTLLKYNGKAFKYVRIYLNAVEGTEIKCSICNSNMIEYYSVNFNCRNGWNIIKFPKINSNVIIENTFNIAIETVDKTKKINIPIITPNDVPILNPVSTKYKTIGDWTQSNNDYIILAEFFNDDNLLIPNSFNIPSSQLDTLLNWEYHPYAISSGTLKDNNPIVSTFYGWYIPMRYNGQSFTHATAYVNIEKESLIEFDVYDINFNLIAKNIKNVKYPSYQTFELNKKVTKDDIKTNVFYVGMKTLDGITRLMSSNLVSYKDFYDGNDIKSYYLCYTVSGLQNVVDKNEHTLKVDLFDATSNKTVLNSRERLELLESKTINIDINLPAKIEAVVGDTIELFYNGMIVTNDYKKYNINFISSKGNRYKNRWIYTPQEGDTDFTIRVEVYDDMNVKLGSNSTTIHINQLKTSPTVSKNILCVGDSLTCDGEWVTELQRRLCQTGGQPNGNNLSNINFIGSCGTAPVKYEGYGGWKWDTYLYSQTDTLNSDIWVNIISGMKDGSMQESIWQDSNGKQWQLETIDIVNNRIKFKHYPIVDNPNYAMPNGGTLIWIGGAITDKTAIVYTTPYAGISSPFYNSKLARIDFKNYCSVKGYSGIDICCILLGWNEIGEKTFNIADHQLTITNAKIFINQLHSDYPNCKIILLGLEVPSQDGLGNNYGSNQNMWNYYFSKQSVFGLNDALEAIAKDNNYNSFVDFANVATQFDSENNMQISTRTVNVRSSKTEIYGTNGVHPALEGYYQIADVAYRNIMSKL